MFFRHKALIAASSGGNLRIKSKGQKMRQKKNNKEDLHRVIQNKKLVLTVYLLLRAMVILVMIAQIINRNYENVFLCLLTLVLFLLPSVIERRLHVDLPDMLEIIILLFIFAAEILGEIQEYYLVIPLWDTILHTINGFLFAAIGFSLINILNEDKHFSLSLSPVYMALTAFCFSMTIGILWEFFEWGMDTVFNLDMQKDTIVSTFGSVMLDPGGHNVPYHISDVKDAVLVFSDGQQMSLNLGGYLDIGLHDTMLDLLVNFVGAVVFSFIGYFYVKTKGKGTIARMFIPRAIEKPDQETENG